MDHLLAVLDRAAAAAPAKTAVMDDLRSMTFAEVARAVDQLASRVAAMTERPRVGVLLPSGVGFAVSFFAVLRAGRVPVPLNLLLTPKELAFCASDAEVDLVLTATPCEALGRLIARGVFLVDQRDAGAAGPWARPAASRPGDPATVLYTSGTTARPKGVVLTHANLLADAEACRRRAHLTKDHILFGLVPLFHTLGLMASLILPVYLGATTMFIPRFQPAAVAEMLARHRPNVVIAVPSMYGALLLTGALANVDTSCLELCICGGEPLPEAVSRAFEAQTGRPLLEGYGLTETSPVVTLNRPEAPRRGTTGPALPGVEVRVVDAAGSDAPTGAEGEVWIRGPMVMAGYHHRPEETAAALTPDGWFRSGDLGRLDEEGCLAITGRLKDLIIISGENVSPREIEEVLLSHPAVAEAAVIGVPDSMRGEVPKAFVVLREGAGAVSATDLSQFCRGRLAGFKTPREIECRPALPKGPTGKVHRRALREEK